MSIQLNPEQERIVEQAMQAGLIRSVDDVAEIGVAVIRDKLNTRHVASGEQEAEEWFRQLVSWSQGHPTSTPLIPDEALDRESIYGGRRV